MVVVPAVLFDRSGSFSTTVTVAVLDTRPAVDGTATTLTTVELPLAMFGSEQVIVPCEKVHDALVPDPEAWAAEAAVLGAADSRFQPLETEIQPHREGRAVACRVPLTAGWSVLRLRRQTERS